MKREKKAKPVRAPKDDETTIRAVVTPDEHEAVRHTAKVTCGGITIDQYVRAAVDAKLKQDTGKGLAELADALKNQEKLVQGELF